MLEVRIVSADWFHYAYTVGDVVFTGKASWNDAESEIYAYKPGDKCRGVEYLTTSPWRSTYRRNADWELHWDKVWMGCALGCFLLGIFWSMVRFRKFQLSVL
jgi:hypothetical protein